MSVWVCVPSARPIAEVQAWMLKWKEKGYRVALWRDTGEQFGADLQLHGEYPGYARATNALIRTVLDADPNCDWVVAGGDDVYPDECHRAEQVSAQCSEHFGSLRETFREVLDLRGNLSGRKFHSTFGVMQPTGDRWGDDVVSRAKWPDAPAMIDRICGSPWIGREFARRINGGVGPFWPEYHHNWCDEELQNVALKLGVLWQRRDLIHFHDHARRNGGKWKEHQQGFDADYVKMKPLFDQRKAAGFPGHEVTA